MAPRSAAWAPGRAGCRLCRERPVAEPPEHLAAPSTWQHRGPGPRPETRL